jgi:hypothetical protein
MASVATVRSILGRGSDVSGIPATKSQEPVDAAAFLINYRRAAAVQNRRLRIGSSFFAP